MEKICRIRIDYTTGKVTKEPVIQQPEVKESANNDTAAYAEITFKACLPASYGGEALDEVLNAFTAGFFEKESSFLPNNG